MKAAVRAWGSHLAGISVLWLALISLASAQSDPATTGAASKEGQQAHGDASRPSGPALPEGYDEAIELGVQEFDLGNFAEARARFLEAHRVYPNARTLRALGMVAYELRHYVSSIQYLKQALESAERPLTPRLRQAVEKLLKRAGAYVGRYRVTLRPPGAQLWADGDEVELGSDGMLMLSVGDHVLESRARSHRPLRRTLRVLGGENEALDLVLLPLPELAASGVERRIGGGAEVDEGSMLPRRKKRWLWTALGVAVAGGLAAGLVIGLRDPGTSGPSETTTGGVIRLSIGGAAAR